MNPLDPVPNTLAIVSAFRDVARDLHIWRDRTDLSDLQEIKRCWRNLLEAHRRSIIDPRQNQPASRLAVEEMTAWRIRMLQSTPLASVTWLTTDKFNRAQVAQLLARLRKAQDRYLHTVSNSGAAIETNSGSDPNPFPLSVSLVPVQLVFIALQRQLERSLSTLQEAEATMASAIGEGDAIVAQRRAQMTDPETQQSPPPTLQELRSRFKSLQREIERRNTSRGSACDITPVNAMLRVIAVLEGKQELTEEQLQGFCGQLQAHFLALTSALK